MFDEKRVGIVAPAEIAVKLAEAVKTAGVAITILQAGERNNMSDCSYDFGRGQRFLSMIIMDEQCDTEALRDLQRTGTKVYPEPDVIDIIRDKEHLLSILYENDIAAVSGWEVVANVEENDHHRHGGQSIQWGTIDPKPTLAFRAKSPAKRMSNYDMDSTHAVVAGKIVSVPVTRTSDNTITCHAPMVLISTDNYVYADHRMCTDEQERELSLACCRTAASAVTAIGLTGTVHVEIVCDGWGHTYVNDINLVANNGLTQPNLKAHPITRELGEILDLLPDTNSPLLNTGIIEPAAFRKNTVRGTLRVLTCPDAALIYKTGKLPCEMEMNELMARSIMVQHLLHS